MTTGARAAAGGWVVFGEASRMRKKYILGYIENMLLYCQLSKLNWIENQSKVVTKSVSFQPQPHLMHQNALNKVK